MNQSSFPEQFSDLEQYRNQWAKPTERERHRSRLTTPVTDLRPFYEAMLGHMDNLVSHLDQFPMDDLPPAESDLLLMSLSFMEVSLPVEMHGTSTVPHGFDYNRFEVTF